MTGARPGHGSSLVTRPPRGPPREGERSNVSNAWDPAPRPDPPGTPVGRSGGGGPLGALHRGNDVRRVTRPRSTNTDQGECAMSIPSMKPQSRPARPRDRRFYQPIRLPRPDSAWPGTPDDPPAEPTGARRTAN